MTTNDFKVSYITKYGTKMDKDTIKAKISVLPDIIDIFNKEIVFEEDFSKGQYVSCGIALGEGILTLGFVVRQNCRPETLLKGNYIHQNKACKPSLIMSAPGGATTKFDTIILGNENEIKKSINEIGTLISKDILEKIK
ncbi:MAG: hypothetical protein LUD22_02870 [Coprobacillus sp.]|nr:hypothetical protein [Coprobacillus sp.]